MSLIAIAMNLLLAVLLLAALFMGWRLNRRLKALRDSHDGFAQAVAELDAAARRAEQGLADLRAATDEAAETLSDRIEKARQLSQRLDRQLKDGPALRDEDADEAERAAERRLGALLSGAHELRPPRPRSDPARPRPTSRMGRAFDEDLFDSPDAPPSGSLRGDRR